MASASTEIEIRGDSRDAQRALQQTEAAMRNMERTTRSLESALNSAKGAMAALVASFSIRELARYADEYTNFTNKIKLATKSLAELELVQKRLYQISQIAGQPLNVTAGLYGKIILAAEQLNASQNDVIRVTEIVSKALAASGTSATEAAGALMQMGQAFNSPRVMAEEFNSMNQTMPGLIKEVTKALGLQAGTLKAYVNEGKLSNKELFDAIIKSQKAIDEQFSSASDTISVAMQRVSNAFTMLIGNFEKSTGTFGKVADGITFLAENMDELVLVLKAVALGFAIAFSAKIVSMIKAVTVALLGLGTASKANIIGLFAAVGLYAAETTGMLDTLLEKIGLIEKKTATAQPAAATNVVADLDAKIGEQRQYTALTLGQIREIQDGWNAVFAAQKKFANETIEKYEITLEQQGLFTKQLESQMQQARAAQSQFDPLALLAAIDAGQNAMAINESKIAAERLRGLVLLEESEAKIKAITDAQKIQNDAIELQNNLLRDGSRIVRDFQKNIVSTFAGDFGNIATSLLDLGNAIDALNEARINYNNVANNPNSTVDEINAAGLAQATATGAQAGAEAAVVAALLELVSKLEIFGSVMRALSQIMGSIDDLLRPFVPILEDMLRAVTDTIADLVDAILTLKIAIEGLNIESSPGSYGGIKIGGEVGRILSGISGMDALTPVGSIKLAQNIYGMTSFGSNQQVEKEQQKQNNALISAANELIPEIDQMVNALQGNEKSQIELLKEQVEILKELTNAMTGDAKDVHLKNISTYESAIAGLQDGIFGDALGLIQGFTNSMNRGEQELPQVTDNGVSGLDLSTYTQEVTNSIIESYNAMELAVVAIYDDLTDAQKMMVDLLIKDAKDLRDGKWADSTLETMGAQQKHYDSIFDSITSIGEELSAVAKLEQDFATKEEEILNDQYLLIDQKTTLLGLLNQKEEEQIKLLKERYSTQAQQTIENLKIQTGELDATQALNIEREREIGAIDRLHYTSVEVAEITRLINDLYDQKIEKLTEEADVIENLFASINEQIGDWERTKTAIESFNDSFSDMQNVIADALSSGNITDAESQTLLLNLENRKFAAMQENFDALNNEIGLRGYERDQIEQITFAYQQEIAALETLAVSEQQRLLLANSLEQAKQREIALVQQQVLEQENLNRARQLDSLGSVVERLFDSFESEVKAIEELIHGIGDTIREIKYSTLSILTPQNAIDSVEDDYQALRDAAFNPDATKEDIQRFQEFANTYLEQQQRVFKSSSTYRDVFANVIADLESLTSVAAQSQFDIALDRFIEGLDQAAIDFEYSLDDVIAELENLRAAFFTKTISVEQQEIVAKWTAVDANGNPTNYLEQAIQVGWIGVDENGNPTNLLVNDIQAALRTTNANGQEIDRYTADIIAMIDTVDPNKRSISSITSQITAYLQTIGVNGQAISGITAKLTAGLQTVNPQGKAISGITAAIRAGLITTDSSGKAIDRISQSIKSGVDLYVWNPNSKKYELGLNSVMQKVTLSASFDTNLLSNAFSTLTSTIQSRIAELVSAIATAASKLSSSNVSITGTNNSVATVTVQKTPEETFHEALAAAKASSQNLDKEFFGGVTYGDYQTKKFTESNDNVKRMMGSQWMGAGSKGSDYLLLSGMNSAYLYMKPLYDWAQANKGHKWSGYRFGGMVQHHPEDTIPAMLAPGEFIMSPEATNRIGVSNLNAWNRGSDLGYSDKLEQKLDELLNELRNRKTTVNVENRIDVGDAVNSTFDRKFDVAKQKATRRNDIHISVEDI